MRKTNFVVPAIAVMALGLMIFSGCGGGDSAGTSSTAGSHDDHDDHDHPSEGPHHGGLVELGNEEYHAELVHDDDAGTVTIYLLDSSAKSAVPIEATELLINLSHDGEAEQFTLASSPDAGDPAGKSSRFVSDDEELVEDLDHEGADAQLVVTIAGKQYRGEIEHDHDEEEHAHEDSDH
ncbi:MAG: hypothetical protein GXP28_00540 [Planctomycetes bacterium]|nr:hypothetical protein [Planctomycetota bacterium]